MATQARLFSNLGTVSFLALAVAGLGQISPAAAQQAPTPPPASGPVQTDGAPSKAPAQGAGSQDATAPDAASPVLPQQQNGDAPAPASDIIVTGSRLVTSSYNSPTPVNVVGEERQKALSISNVADALNQLPAFRPLTAPSTNFFRVQTVIAARTLDLRGLGPQRTLTLVDGRRFVPSSDLGTVDLNVIPSALVGRSEVVTGGASAAYGADAVAGVVNLILDTKFTGLKAEANYGISERGDGMTEFVSLAFGAHFAGGRGHILVGGEYAHDGGVGDCNTRAWCAKDTNYVPNPTPGNGQPANIVTNNVLFITNPAGVIQTGPLAGHQFDRSGNLLPFTFGSPVSGQFMVGGDPSVKRAYLIDSQPLSVANQHLSLMAHADFDVTNSIQASLELSYAFARGGPSQSLAAYDFNMPIAIDNAYLSPQTVAAMNAAGVTSVPVNKVIEQTGPQAVAISRNRVYRGVFALKGDLSSSWHWDAYYSYGQTDGRLNISNVRYTSRYNQAIDAVRAPAGNAAGIPVGTIVCRSTLTNPTNGCLPLDYLGEGTADPGAINWIEQSAWQTRKFTENAAAANVRGSLFNLGAGPVQLAVGGEFRSDRYSGAADPLSRAGVLYTVSAVDLPAGGQDVTEGYAELNVPLLKDSRFGKSLAVDGAIRQTHYSESGSATTWKLGAVYSPVSAFLFRITRSHDIRAPTAAELSPIATTIQLPLNDTGTTHGNYIITTTTSGNPNLTLEQANTFTVGGVFKPAFLPRFHMSLDYYNIKMTSAIDVLSAQATINLCAAGNTALCQFITRGSNGLITSVASKYQNLSSLHAEGLEFVSDYNFDVDSVIPGFHGNLALTLNANYVFDLSSVGATGAVTQFDDWTGNPGSVSNILGVPRWRADGVATYSTSRYSVSFHGRFIPNGLLDPTKIGPEQAGYSVSLPNSISTNKIDSRFYLDITGRVNIAKTSRGNIELFANVNNVFDVSEPPTLRLIGNPLYFDPIMRAYKVGVRMQL